MARERVEYDVVGNDRGGSKVFRDTGDAAAKAGDQVKGLGEDFRGLDAEIERSKAQLRTLATELDRTGNKDLFKNIRQQQRELRQLMNVRNVMTDAGEDGAEGFSAGFVARVGPLLARAPLSPPIIAGVAAAAPFIATAVGGAITAGIAGAAVGAGLKVAFNDPAVQAARDEFGDEMSQMLTAAAQPFVPETVKGIDIVRRELRGLEDELDDIFGDSSRYVQPLARGLGGLARELAPGLRDAVANAEPLVDLVEEHLPEMGRTLGDAFERMSTNAANMKTTLDATLTTLEGMVSVSSFVVQALSSDIAQGVMDPLGLQEIIAGSDGTVKVLKDIEGGFNATDTAADGATMSVRDFYSAMREATDVNLDARQAQRELEAAIDTATATIDENGRTLNRNTAAGRENEAALDAIRARAYAAADGITAAGGSQDQANAALERGRQAFVAAAVAAGMERKAAEALAAQLFALPSKPGGTIVYNDKPAQDAINRVVQAGGRVKDIHRGIYYTVHGDLKVPGGTLTKNSEGGLITGPGTGTSDDIITRVSNGEYVIREGAAQVLGVDYLNALNQIDRTGGIRTAAASAGRAGGVTSTASVDADRIARAVKDGVREALRGVVLQIDDRTGRIVDGYARTG